MAHLINRRGYWSLEASYRDPVTGKPRKHYLKYFGKRRPDDPQARMAQMLDTAERKAEEIAEQQRAQFGETASERQDRLREEAKFSPQKFMEETTSPSSPGAFSSPAEQSQQCSTGQQSEASPSDASSEPDAEPSEGEGS